MGPSHWAPRHRLGGSSEPPPKSPIPPPLTLQALAIGDGANDLTMLRAAGTSVAMGNAAGTVKAEAQHVVGTNAEDGWVEAMERFVLDRL